MTGKAYTRRQKRTRGNISGTSRLRLSVSRSNKGIYAQIIDDAKGITLVGIGQKAVKDTKGTKTEKAFALGELIAEKAKEKKVTAIVFDKGAYRYHGRVKAVAQGARKGGLVF